MSSSSTLPTAFKLSLILVLGAAVSACGYQQSEAAAAPEVDLAAEEAAIMALERDWSSHFAQGDVDWIMGIHRADAVQLPPGADMVVGAPAIREAWQGMADTEGLQVSWTPVRAEVSPDGNMAFDYGTATMTTADGVSTPMKYMVVWTKEDGEWKVVADMFNANVAPGN